MHRTLVVRRVRNADDADGRVFTDGLVVRGVGFHGVLREERCGSGDDNTTEQCRQISHGGDPLVPARWGPGGQEYGRLPTRRQHRGRWPAYYQWMSSPPGPLRFDALGLAESL